jgi:heterodisulfide reductase subunit A
MTDKVGAVMVVGAGIGGMQAALTLADSGFKVYLVETTPSVGGVMSALDKTFPTNECAMCTITPTLVGTGRHPNIDIVTCADIDNVSGEAGNFTVTVNKRARFINEEKCTGCGLCAQYCPREALSEFDRSTMIRNAVFVPYPQSVPLVYKIDKDKCIGCGLCEKYCKAGAIEYDQQDEKIDLNVGSVILCPGFETFDPDVKKELGYSDYPNVITSIEYERILSASGPYSGHVLRPADGKIPKKIAWLQCIGSRDEQLGIGYCSAVCCTYATKEAIMTLEHVPGADCHIFFMDIRTFGKGFEEYYESAKKQGIKYTRCRIPHIEQTPNKDLKLRFRDEDGVLQEETFNLVVLSVGLRPVDGVEELAKKFDIDLNEYNFCHTDLFTPVETSRSGVFVSGAFSGPKDIPDTVAQSMGAAVKASGIIASERGKLVEVEEYPEEKEVAEIKPRIGVFVCHCGVNISAIVDCAEVSEYAKTLPYVVFSDHTIYTCSSDTQKTIKEVIKEYDLNRVIVASCTPRTHEPLFQNTIREAGINPFLFDLTSLREHVSWVHRNDPKKATEKAKLQVAKAVARVRMNKPVIKSPVDVVHSCVIIGGGIAGMTAALDIAEQGFDVYLIEKEPELGGNLKNIYHTLEGSDPQQFLKEIIEKVKNNDKIHVYTNSKIADLGGYVGNFEIKVETATESTANDGGDVEIQNVNDNKSDVIKAGAIVVATGAKELKPDEYFYGKNDKVLTQLELDKVLWSDESGQSLSSIDPRLDAINFKDVNDIVMIQCVGSRCDERPYCSRVCCAEAVKNALKIKEKYPEKKITILYRDLRTYGYKEKYYREAREKGIVFIRYDKDEKPEVIENGDKLDLIIRDHIIQKKLKLHPDLIVLSAATIPFHENEELGQILKVPLTSDNFFLEAHLKIKPLDFSTEGVFLCGTAHSPKFSDETIAQASGAAARAISIISQNNVETEGIPVIVDEERCVGCGICEANCSYSAIKVNPERGVAEVTEVLCKGCGTCSNVCPSSVPSLRRFEPKQLIAMIEAATEEASA